MSSLKSLSPVILAAIPFLSVAPALAHEDVWEPTCIVVAAQRDEAKAEFDLLMSEIEWCGSQEDAKCQATKVVAKHAFRSFERLSRIAAACAKHSYHPSVINGGKLLKK